MTTVPHAPTPGNRLVIFAPNWLGDAVMALPAIADVRRARPDASISVAARPSIAPLFRLVDGMSRVIDSASLERQAFDEALLLPNSFHASFAAWRAGIPERWGYRTQGRAPLLTRAVTVGPRVHQTAYYQHLTNALGFPGPPAKPRLRVSPEIRQAGEDMLIAAGWAREVREALEDRRAPLVAFAPGATNGRAKQWPPESFAAVGAGLLADGVVPVLVGAASDVRAGTELTTALGARSRSIINLIGRTDLPALAGVLAHCRALVCNDSGAMHFGAALGLNVTAMFGPSNDVETRPLGDAALTVLTHDVWCRPCMLRECPLDHRCMRGITVDAVLAAARAAVNP